MRPRVAPRPVPTPSTSPRRSRPRRTTPRAAGLAGDAPAPELVDEADAISDTTEPEEPAAETEPVEPAAEEVAEPTTDAAAEAEEQPADAETEAVGEPEPAPVLPDVDDVFARLRAGAAEAEANGTAAAAAAPVGEPAPTPTPLDRAAPVVAAPPHAADATADLPDWLAARDTDVLAPLRSKLVRQVKLAVGNEQNEVLDKIRRQKGRPAATAVLPDVETQVTAWAAVVTSASSEAYRAARSEHGAPDDGAIDVPEDLAAELARTLIEPLRERLVAAIDTAHEPGETSAQVAERIGARYREWKNRAAESSSRRRARRRLLTRALRRRGRGFAAHVADAARGLLPRLRRQRAGADREG